MVETFDSSCFLCLRFLNEFLKNALLAVVNRDVDVVFPVQVFRQVLCRIDTAMLPARTSEGEHQVGETTFHVTLHVEISQLINAFEELKNFAILLKELNHWGVQTREFFVGFIFPRIVRGATVKYVSASVAATIGWDAALFVGETEYTYV